MVTIKFNNIYILLFVAIVFLLCINNNTIYSQRRQSQKVWYELLPDCPCKNPGNVLNDGWAIDKGDLSKYHKGASISIRSYPAIRTSEGKSGQQCCYDINGDLITSGPAAGTPDKVSSCQGEDSKGFMKVDLLGLVGHFRKDVKPWDQYMKQDSLGWQKYNASWIPNAGKDCLENIK